MTAAALARAPSAGARASRRPATPSGPAGRTRPAARAAGAGAFAVTSASTIPSRCASRSTSTRRCTTTGTLLSDAAQRRFGIDLPYEEQFTGASRRLQARAAAGLHRRHALRDGDPARAGPTRTRSRPSTAGTRQGHFIHITSHRAEHCHAATGRWLDQIGLAVRRAVLLLRQGRPLPRDRDRRADRRQPGEHRRAPRRGHRGGDDRATRGTRTSARRRTSSARRDWPELGRRARAACRVGRRPPPRAWSGRRATRDGRRAARRSRRADLRDLLPADRARAPRSTTGAARSASRASSTARSSTSSTTCGSAARSRASSTSRPTAARCVVSNHAGALPPDAAMIAKAIKEEHPRPRPLHITVEHFFKGYPGFSMLLPKIGCVPAHPANVHRLLCRRAAARARLPRGPQGHREALQGPLPPAPLRPRRLRRGGDARRRADRPGRRRRRRGGGADLRPRPRAAAADRPASTSRSRRRSRTSGCSGCSATCPRSSASASSRRCAPTTWATEPWQDKALVQTVADEVRATIQENVLDMVARRSSVWF